MPVGKIGENKPRILLEYMLYTQLVNSIIYEISILTYSLQVHQ